MRMLFPQTGVGKADPQTQRLETHWKVWGGSLDSGIFAQVSRHGLWSHIPSIDPEASSLSITGCWLCGFSGL